MDQVRLGSRRTVHKPLSFRWCSYLQFVYRLGRRRGKPTLIGEGECGSSICLLYVCIEVVVVAVV